MRAPNKKMRMGCNSLIHETLNTFEKHAWDITDGKYEKSARIVADLLLLGLTRSVDLRSGQASVRAANLARAKRVIRRRLSDTELTLLDVAREVGLSLDYLHELFRENGEGHTMREYLRSQRLQRARELLELSSPHNASITDISLECGFSNMSHFSSALKRAFGLSPRDVARISKL